jgi:hypothetical protein
LLQSRAAQGWAKVPCRILQCQLTTHVSHSSRGGSSTSYNLALTYLYVVGDQKYQSGDYDFTFGSTGDYNWWAAGVDKFPAGKPAVCFVNPQNPAMAVLVRSFDRNSFLWIFTGGLGLIGLGVAAVAAYRTWRRVKFGESVLELANAPAALGAPLAGTIALSRTVQPVEGFVLRLACIHRVVTGTGKQRQVHEDILWQDEQKVDSLLGDAVSVPFALPQDGEATDGADVNDRIFWRLDAKAKMPGVDYAAEFEVPVVSAPRADTGSTAARPQFNATADDDAHYQPPGSSRIRVQDTNEGKEFYFPAFRNPGAARFLTFFTLFWTGVVGFLIEQHAPALFAVVFSGFDGVLIGWTLHEWFATTRVVAGRDGIVLTKHFCGLGRPRTLGASAIREINIVHGETYNNVVLYNIQIELNSGRKVTAGDEVPDAHEAHWLALEMARCAGVGR